MAHEPHQAMSVRMFVDDVSGVGLWHHDGNVEGLEGDLEENLEDRLPMPDQLRQRIKTWIDEYTASISDPDVRARWTTDVDLEHDMRGYELSRKLQEALGPRFRIEYMFHTREGRRLSDER